MSNADVVKKFIEDFGLSQSRIYELIPDEYKREKADSSIKGTPKDVETKIPRVELSKVIYKKMSVCQGRKSTILWMTNLK